MSVDRVSVQAGSVLDCTASNSRCDAVSDENNKM